MKWKEEAGKQGEREFLYSFHLIYSYYWRKEEAREEWRKFRRGWGLDRKSFVCLFAYDLFKRIIQLFFFFLAIFFVPSSRVPPYLLTQSLLLLLYCVFSSSTSFLRSQAVHKDTHIFTTLQCEKYSFSVFCVRAHIFRLFSYSTKWLFCCLPFLSYCHFEKCWAIFIL